LGVTPAELWARTADDPEQLDLMIAHVELEHEIGPHGIPLSEATDPRADPTFYGEGSFGFKVHHVMDWAQHALSADHAALRKENPDVNLADYRFVVERVDYDTGGAGG
jgi:hypothetical protein